MPILSAALISLLPLFAGERPAIVVNAPDAPVRVDKAALLTATDGPPLLYYAATNVTADEFEVFTVTAFVFDNQGTLKARQTAPGRRTLAAHETKYSTLVLDGSPVAATDIVVVGVNQAQRAGSETWWRGELDQAAKAAAAQAVQPAKK